MDYSFKTYHISQDDSETIIVVPLSDIMSEYFLYNRQTKTAVKIENMLQFLSDRKKCSFYPFIPSNDEFREMQKALTEYAKNQKTNTYQKKNKI